MPGTRSHAAILAALAIVLSTRGPGCDGMAPAASDEPSREDLQTRVEAFEGLIRDQAHIMADVDEHFTNSSFAGTAENWPLADFYLAEAKSHLHWAVRRIPIRRDNRGKEADLDNILEAFENSQLADLKQTIGGRDEAGLERSYREAPTMCYSRRKAADKPFLRPRITEAPDRHIINFDPKADWPP